MRVLSGAALLGAVLFGGGAQAATQLTHDELDRLTQVQYANGRSQTYSYDAAGNLTRRRSSRTPPVADLVGFWRFDDCSGTDASGADRPATITHSTCTDAYAGKGLEFKNPGYNEGGGSDWVTLPAHPSAAVTFSAWVNWRGNPDGAAYAGALWSLGIHTEKPFLSVWINEGNGKVWTDHYTTSRHKLVPGVWTMVTIASDGTTESLYLNGKLLNSATLPVPMNFSGLTGYIARHFWAGGQNAARFRGLVDEARTYSRALTEAEVQALFDAEQAKRQVPTN